jgi:putative tricarboxylic transport membrane protein
VAFPIQDTGRGDPRPVRGRTDRMVAGVALLFCVVVYGLTYTFDSVPAALMSGLGAELFPRLVLWTMALLAGLMALLIGITPMEPPAAIPRMVWLTAGAMFAFMGVVEIAGLWAANFLFLVGVGRMWGERSLVKLSAAALGLCLVLYLLFVKLLHGTFPKGVLGEMFWS